MSSPSYGSFYLRLNISGGILRSPRMHDAMMESAAFEGAVSVASAAGGQEN